MPIQHKVYYFWKKIVFFHSFQFPPFPLMNQTVNKLRCKESRSAFHVPAFAPLSATLLKLSPNTEWYLKSLSETICIGSVWKC